MNYWEKLFHTCAIAWSVAFMLALSGVASAETFTVTGKIIDSQPVYKTRTINTKIDYGST